MELLSEVNLWLCLVIIVSAFITGILHGATGMLGGIVMTAAVAMASAPSSGPLPAAVAGAVLTPSQASTLAIVGADSRRLQSQVPCSSEFPLDYDYEACLGWCPNNPAANCGRCKCAACQICGGTVQQSSSPPPPPPWRASGWRPSRRTASRRWSCRRAG